MKKNYIFGNKYNFGCYGELYFVCRVTETTIWVTDKKPKDVNASGWFTKG